MVESFLLLSCGNLCNAKLPLEVEAKLLSQKADMNGRRLKNVQNIPARANTAAVRPGGRLYFLTLYGTTPKKGKFLIRRPGASPTLTSGCGVLRLKCTVSQRRSILLSQIASKLLHRESNLVRENASHYKKV